MATGAWFVSEFGWEPGEVEFVLEGEAVGRWGEEVVGLASGKGAEGCTSGEAEEGGEIEGDVSGGSLGEEGGDSMEVLVAKLVQQRCLSWRE